MPGIVKLLSAPEEGGAGAVASGAVVAGTVGVPGTVAVVVAVLAGDEDAAGTVTVAGAGVDSGVSSSVTSAIAMPVASSASSTSVRTIGMRQLGGG